MALDRRDLEPDSEYCGFGKVGGGTVATMEGRCGTLENQRL